MIVRRITLALLLIAFCLSGQAQNETMTPEKLWKIGRLGGASLSPDGNWILFGVSRYEIDKNKGDRNLFRIKTDGKNQEQLTFTKGSEYNERWHPSGDIIGYISSASGSPQIWERAIDQEEEIQVTNIAGGINGFEYSPDGKSFLYTKDVALDENINDKYPDLPKANVRVIDDLMFRHWSQWHDYSYSHIFVLNRNEMGKSEGKDIMKGETFDTPLNPFGGMEEICWSPDSKSIIYICKKKNGKEYAVSTNSDLYQYNIASGKTKNISIDGKGYDNHPVFNADGSELAWLRMKRDGFESDKNDIVIMNMESGSMENITAKFDMTVSNFSWSKDASKIYISSAIEATYQIFVYDRKKGTLDQITKGDHNIGSFAVINKGKQIIAMKQDMIRPYELYKIESKSGEAEKITSTNDAFFAKLKKPTVEKRWITTTDNKRMLTWVILPPDFDPNKKYPTLLYCQGGPQSAVSQFFSYRWNFHLMAANGYIIVAPNRRGLPSFGREWNDDISKDWGGQCMNDYLSAIDAIAKEPFVDENKLGAVGASFGGYSVYYLAGIHENRFKTFISHCGLFNLESWYGTTEEMFFANWDIGGPYWDPANAKDYQKFSPHKKVANWNTPIMVIHGEKDFRVPISEGLQAFQVAQLKDIPSRFLYFPTEGHWVQSPQNGLVWHREFFGWLDQWLK